MMNKTEIDAAVAYNVKRNYTRIAVCDTQRTVGAVDDGLWGPDTVQAVARWQKEEGLCADGKVGDMTWERVLEAVRELSLRGVVEIGCGLAAYDQTWPGHPPEEALQAAWDAAISEGCKEIRFWSSEWLMDDLGNKGNKYAGSWLASQVLPDGVTVGAWIDDPSSVAKSAEFAQRLVAMHVTRAALMINKSNAREGSKPWVLRWSRDDLEEISDTYRSHGIEIVCTTWPRPSRVMIDEMCEDMKWILATTGSTTFEVDTEGNWRSKFLDGFKSMADASVYLAEKMRDAVGESGALELTTYTYHRENSSKATLAPLMDRLLPQAYSVRHRTHETIEWGGSLGPGRHQKLAIDRARDAAGSRGKL